MAEHRNRSVSLTWPNFQDVYLASGEPATIRLLQDPACYLMTFPGGRRLSLRIECEAAPTPKGIPKVIAVQNIHTSGSNYLEVSVEQPALRRPFFFLALAIRDLLEDGTYTPYQALLRALADNRALLVAAEMLSEVELVGLFGELWFLNQLLDCRGPSAVRAWTGPQEQPHDFRFGDTEVEVKTTRSARRVHTINGLAQLSPAVSCSLFLLSIQAQPTGPGAGSSIPEMIQTIRQKLEKDAPEEQMFMEALRAMEYPVQSENQPDLRVALANPPHLIEIKNGFPALTRAGVIGIVGATASQRILDVSYDLDVTGMGYEYGTPEFQRLIDPKL